MARDIAVFPGGAPDGMLDGLTAAPGMLMPGIGVFWGGRLLGCGGWACGGP
jgi:hypothetical protein